MKYLNLKLVLICTLLYILSIAINKRNTQIQCVMKTGNKECKGDNNED